MLPADTQRLRLTVGAPPGTQSVTYLLDGQPLGTVDVVALGIVVDAPARRSRTGRAGAAGRRNDRDQRRHPLQRDDLRAAGVAQRRGKTVGSDCPSPHETSFRPLSHASGERGENGVELLGWIQQKLPCWANYFSLCLYIFRLRRLSTLTRIPLTLCSELVSVTASSSPFGSSLITTPI